MKPWIAWQKIDCEAWADEKFEELSQKAKYTPQCFPKEKIMAICLAFQKPGNYWHTRKLHGIPRFTDIASKLNIGSTTVTTYYRDLHSELRQYGQRPEVKERRKEYTKEYWQRPEVKERRRIQAREYRQRKKEELRGETT
jgi:hypothetical protein